MDDLRPIAEGAVRDLWCLLYPAPAGHDLVVYGPRGASWSARFAFAARVVGGEVAVSHGRISAADLARALAWARREVSRG